MLWIDMFSSLLSDASSATLATARLTHAALRAVNLDAPEPVMGSDWLRMYPEQRLDIARRAVAALAADGLFWFACPRCHLRSLAHVLAQDNGLQLDGTCTACGYTAAVRWESGEMPSTFIPRVLLDDLMDIELSDGEIFAYPRSMNHLAIAGRQWQRIFAGSTTTPTFHASDVQFRRAWESSVPGLPDCSLSGLDPYRSAFVFWYALALVLPPSKPDVSKGVGSWNGISPSQGEPERVSSGRTPSS